MAQVSGISINQTGYDIVELINVFFAIALLAAGFLCLIFILWAGISFILSGGDETKVKSAVNTFRYAVIGLLIVIVSFTVVAFIGRFFGFDLTGYISWENMYRIINTWTVGSRNTIELD